jgi:NADP-dependent 3-hydroxy acid dehydrogenase YdfG
MASASSTNTKPLVVITGASSGIGEACARSFSAAGHPLLLVARRLDRLQALNLPNTICAQVDVTDRPKLKEAIENAVAKYGPVDCLVNNAGVMLLGKVQTQDPEEWQRMFDVNLMGVLNGTHVVLPSMIERRGGTIVNISSIAGRKTLPDHAVYCATKFAVHAFTEQIREEVSQYDVRLVNIAPGVVETELLSHSTDKQIVADYKSWKSNMGQPMESEDISRSIMFAYQQPQRVCIREILLCPTRQDK